MKALNEGDPDRLLVCNVEAAGSKASVQLVGVLLEHETIFLLSSLINRCFTLSSVMTRSRHITYAL